MLKKMFALIVTSFVCCSIGLAVAGTGACTPQEAKTVEQDLLSASQIACVELSSLTDAKAVATACAIDSALVPILQQLIGQREAAKQVGVSWQAPDAGSDASK